MSLSEEFFAIRHYLENQYNTTNRINMTFEESTFLIDKLYALEEKIIALENAAARFLKASDQPAAPNVIRFDQWKAKRKK